MSAFTPKQIAALRLFQSRNWIDTADAHHSVLKSLADRRMISRSPDMVTRASYRLTTQGRDELVRIGILKPNRAADDILDMTPEQAETVFNEAYNTTPDPIPEPEPDEGDTKPLPPIRERMISALTGIVSETHPDEAPDPTLIESVIDDYLVPPGAPSESPDPGFDDEDDQRDDEPLTDDPEPGDDDAETINPDGNTPIILKIKPFTPGKWDGNSAIILDPCPPPPAPPPPIPIRDIVEARLKGLYLYLGYLRDLLTAPTPDHITDPLLDEHVAAYHEIWRIENNRVTP
jgi:hypothetical protein